ncbi:MAG: PIN domain-containing protein, partial [Verrucomicrobiales bacterium]
MKAVFDTNILVDYLNGIESAAKEISLFETRLISVITFIEVLVGARDQEEERVIRDFLGGFQVRELNANIASETVQVRKLYRLKVPDAIIYATAKEEG